MGRSQDSFNKKNVRSKKEKKRKEKEEKRLAKKENQGKNSFDDMIAYVDQNGVICSTPPDPESKEEIKLENIKIGVPKKEDEKELDPIRKGVVSFFNESKGFGFIKDLETKESVFVHVNNLLDRIKENNIVTFEVDYGAKGLIAIKVKLFKEGKETATSN